MIGKPRSAARLQIYLFETDGDIHEKIIRLYYDTVVFSGV
jgi:hypothetical protein